MSLQHRGAGGQAGCCMALELPCGRITLQKHPLTSTYFMVCSRGVGAASSHLAPRTCRSLLQESRLTARWALGEVVLLQWGKCASFFFNLVFFPSFSKTKYFMAIVEELLQRFPISGETGRCGQQQSPLPVLRAPQCQGERAQNSSAYKYLTAWLCVMQMVL